MAALADASTLFSPKRPRSNRPFPYAFLPWDMRASGVPADGADPDLVRKAVEGGVCAKRLPASLRDSPAALQNLGLACGGVLTNAAALLFAESCRPLVACRAYDSPYRDVLVDGCDCAGPLDGACGKACAFSLRNAHVAFGSGRAGDSVYAGLVSSVLREAVVNALIHRDYLYFAPVRIDVLPGCIEISNPGMLPSGVLSAPGRPHRLSSPMRYAEYVLGRAPSPRNALLVQLLYRFGVVDGKGAGMARIVAACGLCGLEARWRSGDGRVALSILDPAR